jgi:hypothetical protein
MAAAVALRKTDILGEQTPPSRAEVLARYRRLRALTMLHHSKATAFLPGDAMLHQARRLGLAHGRTLVLENPAELNLAYDLAIHTSPAGRSRTIDRYARSAPYAKGSDEALVLEAMCDARFALLSVERRHPSAGLILTDVVREIDLWLMDEGLEISFSEGSVFATRYFVLDDFAMKSGPPLDRSLPRHTIELAPQLLRKSLGQAIEDRRFAEALYRAAIADGVTARIITVDVTAGNVA